MPEIMKVGSFMIQSKLLILIVSIIFAYYVVRWKLGRIQASGDISRKMLDKFINSVILAVLVWKFTPLLHDPTVLWTRPLSLLAYTGGTLGILLGAASGVLYAVIALWRVRLLTPLALDVLAFGMLVAWMPYRLVFWEYGILTDMPWGISLTDSQYRYHPVNVYAGIWAYALAVYALVARNSRWGAGTVARDILTGLGLGWFAVTFLQRTEPVFLLTTEQWLLLLLAACGMFMPYIARLIQSPHGEHTIDGKEMMDVVKETSMNSSPEQRKQAQENRAEAREYKPTQAVDKKLDGPNRPAE